MISDLMPHSNFIKWILVLVGRGLFPMFVGSLLASPLIQTTAARANPAESRNGLPWGPAGLRAVLLPGGSYLKGTNDGAPYEGPVTTVTVAPFRVAVHPVTVAQFRKFIVETGHLADAQQEGSGGVLLNDGQGWRSVPGATWSHPEGPNAIPAPDNCPVTQVSFRDATAYATWAGGRLPTEAEFEYFARAGHTGRKYFWGDELTSNGRYFANFWQGEFPTKDLGLDGYVGVAPVGSFPPNDYGLFDVAGNVWQLTSDPFDPDPQTGEPRVAMRGGSWLCNEGFCQGYRVAARNGTTHNNSLNNLGFRVVFTDDQSATDQGMTKKISPNRPRVP